MRATLAVVPVEIQEVSQALLLIVSTQYEYAATLALVPQVKVGLADWFVARLAGLVLLKAPGT